MRTILALLVACCVALTGAAASAADVPTVDGPDTTDTPGQPGPNDGSLTADNCANKTPKAPTPPPPTGGPTYPPPPPPPDDPGTEPGDGESGSSCRACQDPQQTSTVTGSGHVDSVYQGPNAPTVANAGGTSSTCQGTIHDTQQDSANGDNPAGDLYAGPTSDALPSAGGGAAAIGCASCGGGGGFPGLLPGPWQSPTFGVPQVFRHLYTKDSQGLQSLGDQAMNWDLAVTTAWNAGSGTALVSLFPPNAAIPLEFVTADGASFSYVAHNGRAVAATCVRDGDDVVITGEYGDRFTAPFPRDLDLAVPHRLPCREVRACTGAVFALAYDALGHLATVQGPLGRLSFAWTLVGVDWVIGAVVGADGRATTYEYADVSGSPSLHRVTHPDGSVDTFTYDFTPVVLPNYVPVNHRLIVHRSNYVRGRTRDLVYFLEPRLGLAVLVEDALGRDLFNRIANGVVDGQVWRYIYDDHGRARVFWYDGDAVLTRIQDPNTGADRRYASDARHHLVGMSDELGRRWSFAYQPDSFLPIGTTYPDGSSDGRTLQPGTHRWTSRTDRLGRTTTIARDAQGLPRDVVYADGAGEHDDFNAIGQLVRHVDALGRQTLSFYAADGDPAHAPTAWDDPANQGWLVAVRLPQDATEASAPTWTYRWDAAIGDLLTATDPTGRTYAFAYDLMHRATRCTYADGSSDAIEYGAPGTPDVGLVVARTDRDGRRTTFAYDASGLEIARTLADGGVIAKSYDAAGRLARQTRFGDTEEYTYDAAARLVAVTRHPTAATALSTTMTYDSQDRAIAETDPYGRSAYSVYDVNDRIVRRVEELTPGAAGAAAFAAAHAGDPPILATAAWQEHLLGLARGADPELVITDSSYLANGLVATSTDGRGIVTSYAYDARDRLIAQTLAAGTADEATTTTTYDAVGNAVSQTGPRGFTTAMTYTARDREATRRFAVGTSDEAVAATTYTPTDHVASRTDERGFTTRYLYCDCCDRLEDVIDPLGFDTHFEYDPVGNRTAVTDGNGLTTTMTWDARDRLLSSMDGAGETTTYAYSDDAATLPEAADLGFGPGASGAATRVTDPLGDTRLEIRDGLERTVRVVDALGNATTTTYDAIVVDGGRSLVETAVADPLGHTARTRADGLGRLASSVDALGEATRYVHDADGNTVGMRDANGVGTDCVFDARNRRVACTDTAGATTTWRYDADGDLAGRSDALGAATAMTYDARDRRASVTDRVGATTAFAYDASSDLVSVTDAEGGVTSYVYDARGQLVAETFPPPTGGTRRYAYDGGRRLVQRLDQAGIATTYTYDGANRLVARSYSSGVAPDTFSYDQAGRLITARSGRYDDVLSRAYDGDGRVTAETLTLDGASFPVQRAFDAADRVTATTYPSGSVAVRGYTARDELADVSFAGAPVAHRAYDAGGRPIETAYGNGVVERRGYVPGDDLVASIAAPGVTSPVPVTAFAYDYDADKRKLHAGDAAPTDAAQAFAYDGEGRLTDWRSTASAPTTQSWDLSPVGDWRSTTIDGATQARAHAPVHAITAIDGLPVLSDAKGNLTFRPAPLAFFAWDDENRLAAAAGIGPRGLFVARYRYDALGRRAQKVVDGSVTTWISDGPQRIVEIAGDPAKAPWIDPHEDLAPPVTGSGPHASLLQQPGTLHIDFRPDAGGAEDGWLADTGARFADHGGVAYGWDRRRAMVDRRALDQPQWDTFARMQSGGTAGTWTIALPDGSYPVVIVMGDAISRDQTDTIAVEGVEIDDPTPAQASQDGYEQGAFDGYAVQAVVIGGRLTIAPVVGAAKDAKLCFVEIGPAGGGIDDATRDRVAQAVARMTAATATPRGVNAKATETVFGRGVDEPLALFAARGPRFVHADALGSVAAITAADGSPVARFRYDAYGARTSLDADGAASPAAGDASATGFTGLLLDPETALYDARSRLYSPGLGRFLGRDRWRRGDLSPMALDGYRDGYSLYAAYFVPNAADPFGDWTKWFFGPWKCRKEFFDACKAKCAAKGQKFLGCVWVADLQYEIENWFGTIGGFISFVHCCCACPKLSPEDTKKARDAYEKARDQLRKDIPDWGKEANGDWSPGHHVDPLSEGGSPTDPDNIVPLPKAKHQETHSAYADCETSYNTPGPDWPYTPAPNQGGKGPR